MDNGKRVRGLRPWSADEGALFEAVNRAEFCVTGVRNRDLQRLLFATAPQSPQERCRRSARIAYLLRILRAHGILHQVPTSHRYKVSPKGRDLLVAVLSAHHASVDTLTQMPSGQGSTR